jgi:hypothetical protein
MATTTISSENIRASAVQRSDLNVSGTAGTNVIAKVVQGTGISISSTGTDSGTGDVTINTVVPGTNTQVIYNSAGALASIPYLTYNGTAVTQQAGTGPGARYILQDPTTTTKQAEFDLSGITAANTRQIKVPDANCVCVVPVASVASNWINAISTAGIANLAQPGFTDISGTISDAQRRHATKANTASQSATFATDTYLTNSNIVLAANSWLAQGAYYCVFDMVKTAAGTATAIITVRAGTLGTTGDAAILTFTFLAGVAAADTGIFEIWATIRTNGATGTLQGMCRSFCTGTGLVGKTNWVITSVSGTINTTTVTNIGVSFNGGTSFSGTCTLAQADYTQ